ncbi:NAD(P)H-dependent oxidoreductase [Candidatus Gracilibacteria bacterium]|nr:NAD(P)H-dependent oxidoreductase [Candidatus Gracilibacteria bacterium]
MKQLIITAHPSSKGFTHKIAKTFKKASEANKNEVEIMNLYHKKYAQDFLAFEEMSDLGAENKVRDRIQSKMSEADEYIFVFPIWWGSMPAIMKNFFDVNFSSGFAFKFHSGGKVDKLLTGKTAKVFATCDAPGFIYKLFPFAMRLKGYLSMYILGFCGIKITDFQIFDTMGKSRDDTNKREQMLKKIKNIAQK